MELLDVDRPELVGGNFPTLQPNQDAIKTTLETFPTRISLCLINQLSD